MRYFDELDLQRGLEPMTAEEEAREQEWLDGLLKQEWRVRQLLYPTRRDSQVTGLGVEQGPSRIPPVTGPAEHNPDGSTT